LKAFYQLVEQQKIFWTVSLGTTAASDKKICERLFNNLWNNKKFSGQFLRSTAKTTQNLESFFQLVEQQKLLWAFCHGSTTQAIKKTWKAFTHLWNNNKFSGYFLSDQQQKQYKIWKDFLPTCGTTKTSLDILS
jgi:hypothetical protein